MSTHNICFHGEIRKILCGYPLLSAAVDLVISYTVCSGIFVKIFSVYCIYSNINPLCSALPTFLGEKHNAGLLAKPIKPIITYNFVLNL